MNRAERRRQEKFGVSKPTIMEQYRKEAYEEGFQSGMSHTIDITFYMCAYTLSYKTGYSKKRIREIMQAIYNNIDSFRTGHLEPEDYDTIVEQMQNDYGIKIN